MSGRTLHVRDGQLITNRKTDRRQSARTNPENIPDWVLRFLLPTALAFSVREGQTGVVGVRVTLPGPYVEARGRSQDWVLQQAADYLGKIAGGLEVRIEQAVLTRDAYPGPTEGGAWRPNVKRTLCMFYVPGPSVVIPRAMDPAIILSVK